ncbi:MAG: HAD family hydrolase [Clostridiales bacterium]|nr:HAD family hydrolase [Clostridiales bacterium]
MKALIFDLDGTLLNTLDDIADSMNSILVKHGLPPHPAQAYKVFVGDGVYNLLRRAAPGLDPSGSAFQLIAEEYSDEYLRRQADKTAPYPGIADLLTALSGLGIKIAVLSNKPHDATIKVISHYFPDVCFDAIIGHRPGYPVKPDPGGVYEILEILGLSGEDVLYLGDTATDMQTAAAARLQSIGALWGFRDKAELAENGAVYFAECPQDVLLLCQQLLGNSPI